MDIINKIIEKLDIEPYSKIIAAYYYFLAGILFDWILRGESFIFTIPLLVLCIFFGVVFTQKA